jgi:hypothetical protein
MPRKSPPRRAEYSLTESALSPFQAEPTHIHISKVAENALGITEEQESRESKSQEMLDGVPTCKERHLPSDAIREEYMVWRTTTEARKVNAANILILCGSIHAEEMAKRFLRDGHQVETDYLCQYG